MDRSHHSDQDHGILMPLSPDGMRELSPLRITHCQPEYNLPEKPVQSMRKTCGTGGYKSQVRQQTPFAWIINGGNDDAFSFKALTALMGKSSRMSSISASALTSPTEVLSHPA